MHAARKQHGSTAAAAACASHLGAGLRDPLEACCQGHTGGPARVLLVVPAQEVRSGGALLLLLALLLPCCRLCRLLPCLLLLLLCLLLLP
jgi:hypothetical protein